MSINDRLGSRNQPAVCLTSKPKADFPSCTCIPHIRRIRPLGCKVCLRYCPVIRGRENAETNGNRGRHAWCSGPNLALHRFPGGGCRYTAPDVQTLAQAIAAKATVAPTWILVGAIVLLAVGCVSVVVGYKRFGALALLAFLVLTTYLFHGFTFWNVINNQARHDHIIYLVMNLSIMGAMLLIVVNGAGQMSLDGKRR